MYPNIPINPYAKHSLFQEISQYLVFFMLLHDVISVEMMISLSKYNQYFEVVNLLIASHGPEE